jgi:hypothetical protein
VDTRQQHLVIFTEGPQMRWWLRDSWQNLDPIEKTATVAVAMFLIWIVAGMFVGGFVDAAVLPVALETATRALDQLSVGDAPVSHRTSPRRSSDMSILAPPWATPTSPPTGSATPSTSSPPTSSTATASPRTAIAVAVAAVPASALLLPWRAIHDANSRDHHAPHAEDPGLSR